MKVLFVSHTGDYSGAPLALLQELRLIKEKTEHITPIVVLLRGGECVKDFQALCKTIYYYSLSSRIIRKLHLEKMLSSFRNAKCIYANSIASLEVAIRIKKQLSIPVIAHIHESESLVKTHLKSKEQLHNVDYFITVSEFSLRNLVDNYDIPSNKITIQHPFYPWINQYYKGEVQTPRPNADKDGFIVGTFLNGSWQKAPELFSLIVNTFFKKYPIVNCKFMLVGVPEDSEAYYRITFDLRRTRMIDKVIFVGYVDNPLYYHSLFDIYMLHSREDSFPLVAEETAIMENPIVCFENATGAADWITQSGCGLIVPYLDIEAMADALYTLYSDEKLRKSMGVKGAETIKTMWEREGQMDMVFSVIQNISNETYV